MNPAMVLFVAKLAGVGGAASTGTGAVLARPCHKLANSPFFTIDPKTPERVIKSNSVPNDAEWAFPYELHLDLRKPVKLP